MTAISVSKSFPPICFFKPACAFSHSRCAISRDLSPGAVTKTSASRALDFGKGSENGWLPEIPMHYVYYIRVYTLI
jgi:hypothetical protein